MEKLLFKNARLVLSDTALENANLLVVDGKIADFGVKEINAEGARVIDIEGD